MVSYSMSVCNLKVSIDGIKLLGMCWKLSSDVLWANEDALEVGPGPLDLKPDGDDRVGCGQLLLPVRDLLQKVPHKLGGHHVLQLDLKGGGGEGEGWREKRRKEEGGGGRRKEGGGGGGRRKEGGGRGRRKEGGGGGGRRKEGRRGGGGAGGRRGEEEEGGGGRGRRGRQEEGGGGGGRRGKKRKEGEEEEGGARGGRRGRRRKEEQEEEGGGGGGRRKKEEERGGKRRRKEEEGGRKIFLHVTCACLRLQPKIWLILISNCQVTTLLMYLVVLQCFNEFFTGIDEHDASSVMGFMVKLHLCPRHIKFLQSTQVAYLIIKRQFHRQCNMSHTCSAYKHMINTLHSEIYASKHAHKKVTPWMPFSLSANSM